MLSPEIDALDTEGNWIASRNRSNAHEKGFWYRYVHVWMLNLPDESVLMQQYPPSVPRGNMWDCYHGNILKGDPSLLSAQNVLLHQLGHHFEEGEFVFAFSYKDEVQEDGQAVKRVVDVYVVPLTHPFDIDKMHMSDDVAGLRYVPVLELEEVFTERRSGYVFPNDVDYQDRLFRVLHTQIQLYIESLPSLDSEQERQHQKAEQLLDTIHRSTIIGLEKSAQLDVISEPAKRSDVYSQSIWHRAVHVWLMDHRSGAVLMLRRGKYKRHFGGRWSCSMGHVKVGEHSLQSALRSIQDDTGLKKLKEEELQYLFQAKQVQETGGMLGGGARLKQVVDVFLLLLPSFTSYVEVPSTKMMKPEKGEVEEFQFVMPATVQKAWTDKDPEWVIPFGTEYAQRLMFVLNKKSQPPGR